MSLYDLFGGRLSFGIEPSELQTAAMPWLHFLMPIIGLFMGYGLVLYLTVWAVRRWKLLGFAGIGAMTAVTALDAKRQADGMARAAASDRANVEAHMAGDRQRIVDDLSDSPINEDLDRRVPRV